MSLRVDPRRLATLKQLAAEAGLRPGELVARWVEERIDAERAGAPAPGAAVPSPSLPSGALDAITARLDELAARLAHLESQDAARASGQAETNLAAPSAGTEPAPKRRRGRPPKAVSAAAATRIPDAPRPPRVPLHEEIAAVIVERGPSTASEIAGAIVERGRYAPPRSAKPLDAASVNSRVSNPVYRSRFTRRDGRIALADSA